MGLFDTQVSGSPLFAAPVDGPTAPVQFGSNYVPPSSAAPVMPSLAPGLSTANPTGATPASAGLNPMTMISMAGMLAGALTPYHSNIARVGAGISQMAQTNQLAAAQLKRDQDQTKFLSDALKYYPPGAVAAMHNMTAGNTGYFGNQNTTGTPAGQPGYLAPLGGGK